MTQSAAQLRQKLHKLEAMASNRNPNAHERAVAQAKADKVRKQLAEAVQREAQRPRPDAQPFVRRVNLDEFAQTLRRASEAAQMWNDVLREAGIVEPEQPMTPELARVDALEGVLHWLDEASTIRFGKDLIATFRRDGKLSDKQWHWVDRLEEIGRKNRRVASRANRRGPR